MHALRIYSAYFAQFLKQRLIYRWDFVASIMSNMLMTVSGLLFVLFLLDGQTVTALGDWSREEVLFIYGYAMISMAIFSSIAINLYGFSDRYIIQGDFDRVLLRPLGTLPQVLFESFNLDSLGSLLVGGLTLSYASTKLALSFGMIDLLWVVVSSVSGACILISIFVLLASFSFHFEDRIGINPPFFNMIAFGRYPLPIFPPVIRFILQWVVPYAFVAFYPATHFFDHGDFAAFCYSTPLVAIVTALIAWGAWGFGVSRYTSTGS
ncbi:MAG: ABC-2 family transporter protein [Bdellovibrionales bacterium]|nr:ABC-2 family transporter protein [Bdellovibrionales bacterium]